MSFSLLTSQDWDQSFSAGGFDVNGLFMGGSEVLHLIPHNPHWISGSQAMWTACVHGHKNIFLIGFDFQEYGKNELNNIYQDTPNYGPRHGDDVFVSWLEQWRNLQKMRPIVIFILYMITPLNQYKYAIRLMK